jgi:tripartite-type tricarboxylate transporter receptor subunit TctC
MRTCSLAAILLAASSFSLATPVQAQDAAASYPSRPIRIVVPFSPGSGSDFFGRQLGAKMTAHWGQQVIVDNRPGAAGRVAGEIVARATPDGHTIMVTSSGIAASAALYPDLPYDTLKDFAPVTLLAVTGTLFITAPNSNLKTIRELIATAKKQPSTLTYGHSGIGSGTHFAGELLNSVMGITTVHVPYKGGTEVITDTIGGRIAFGIVPLAPSVPLVKTGRLHAIGITTKQRNPELPDVPTLNESGAPGYEYIGWFAMFAPAKLPPAIVSKLGAEVAKILAMPDVLQRVKAIGNEVQPGSPEELYRLLRSEIETRKKVFASQAGKTQ